PLSGKRSQRQTDVVVGRHVTMIGVSRKSPDPILIPNARAAQRYARWAAGAIGESKPSEENLPCALGLEHLSGRRSKADSDTHRNHSDRIIVTLKSKCQRLHALNWLRDRLVETSNRRRRRSGRGD